MKNERAIKTLKLSRETVKSLRLSTRVRTGPLRADSDYTCATCMAGQKGNCGSTDAQSGGGGYSDNTDSTLQSGLGGK